MLSFTALPHNIIRQGLKIVQLSIIAVACAVIGGITPVSAVAASAASNNREGQFAAAAAEFKVPKELLLAISYNQSRWETHKGQQSTSGGYGLMHLTAPAKQINGRGKDSVNRPSQSVATPATLPQAAKLLGVSDDSLRKDDNQNIRGAAALLAQYGKDTSGGKFPATLNDWYDAVSKLNGTPDAADFTDDVYATLRDGVSRTTSDGQMLTITKQQVSADPRAGQQPSSRMESHSVPGSQSQTNSAQTATPECPPTISCRFVPARYAQNNPADPVDYGNYDTANRPTDMRIKYIVIHDTEGSYNSSIAWFKDPASYVSANYVIRSKDGAVTQMVKNKDVAWHAGNWYMNMHSIGIEHEGYSAEGAAWYSEAMYRSSAKLVRYLADKYDIPLDREHIIGHDQLPAVKPELSAGMHTDPGPYWDWSYYMSLIGMQTPPSHNPQNNLVTIMPRFKENQPVVTECTNGTCTPLPAQGSNFIYLRTAPNTTASLLTDAALHPDGKPGTTAIEDLSAKAFYGQRFVVAEKKGDWTAIWFNGQKGWFANPAALSKQTAVPAKGNTITPKNGKTSIPVYGRPLPEDSAYSQGVPRQTVVPLQYKISAGQSYYAYDKTAKNDYYHVLTFNHSTPGERVRIVGNETYIPISYNHRVAFVKASDVRFIAQ
jgi:N-acetyl-anhydromuramyl-L-alanine amidase AmpD